VFPFSHCLGGMPVNTLSPSAFSFIYSVHKRNGSQPSLDLLIGSPLPVSVQTLISPLSSRWLGSRPSSAVSFRSSRKSSGECWWVMDGWHLTIKLSSLLSSSLCWEPVLKHL
jgi:hypothetical protein